MWRLVRGTGVLDVNSPYCYLLWFREFADTSVVAVDEQGVAGFVTAFRPPTRPDAAFVWQVAVDERTRGQGLGRRILLELLARPDCREVRFLEATVTPSNRASEGLFRGAAKALGAGCEIIPAFEASLFPGEGHESEMLFRIGPFDREDVLAAQAKAAAGRQPTPPGTPDA